MTEETMITNFRDIGGCSVKNGKLKPGYFYRSGQLDKLDIKQESFLKNDCGIKKIFDFRSEKEVREMPDKVIQGIDYQNIDILASATSNGASLDSMLNDLSRIDQSMIDTYTNIVVSKSSHEGYHDFMMQLLEKKEPVIFHCFAGKDRTGFGAALILKIAGASDDTIMTDYLLTNQLRKKANEELLNQYKDQYTEEELQQLEIALCVNKRYLQHAFSLIEKEYGDFEQYLIQALKLPVDYTVRFQNEYVVQ